MKQFKHFAKRFLPCAFLFVLGLKGMGWMPLWAVCGIFAVVSVAISHPSKKYYLFLVQDEEKDIVVICSTYKDGEPVSMVLDKFPGSAIKAVMEVMEDDAKRLLKTMEEGRCFLIDTDEYDDEEDEEY